MERYVNIHTHHPHEGELSPRSEGIHPWQADSWSDGEPPISNDCEVVGEIGLDYACGVERPKQEALFRAQLQIAQRRRLPVVLHCVKAFEPTMRILAEYDLKGVVFHGFIGSAQQAERTIERGYWLSFGERSFRSPRTVEVLKKIPLSHLFLESDESPTPIAEIYRRAAEIRGEDIGQIARALEANLKKLVQRQHHE